MYAKKLFITIFFGMLFFSNYAQIVEINEEVDIHSLNLYNTARWKALMLYGTEKIASGIDFPMLRMRTGYAAYMLGNFGKSLLLYKKVMDTDPDNKLALYYVYLNNLYINNVTAARFYAAKLPAEFGVSEQITKNKLSAIETEYSYKVPGDTIRKNAQYGRVGINLQLGYRFELQQSGAFYTQTINEPNINPPGVQYVRNSQRININQKEYYAKLIFAATGTLSLIGGFHYLYTPFNNFIYNNTLAFAGIKYATPFVHFDARAYFGRITDSISNQYDAAITTYPLGNTKLYTISKAAYNDQFTFSQIVGLGITKGLWLEGNVTFGKFYKLFENDALYVYNDIDRKNFKAGGSIYASLSKKVQFSLNYTFEQKTRYKTVNNQFYQNSINGGLTWKF